MIIAFHNDDIKPIYIYLWSVSAKITYKYSEFCTLKLTSFLRITNIEGINDYNHHLLVHNKLVWKSKNDRGAHKQWRMWLYCDKSICKTVTLIQTLEHLNRYYWLRAQALRYNIRAYTKQAQKISCECFKVERSVATHIRKARIQTFTHILCKSYGCCESFKRGSKRFQNVSFRPHNSVSHISRPGYCSAHIRRIRWPWTH